MNPTPTLTFSEPPRAPVVRPDPAPAAIQAERIRQAGLKRERRAKREAARLLAQQRAVAA